MMKNRDYIVERETMEKKTNAFYFIFFNYFQVFEINIFNRITQQLYCNENLYAKLKINFVFLISNSLGK